MIKISKEKALKCYKIISWIFAVMLIISTMIFIYQEKEIRSERLLKEASMELFKFSINVSNYCAESNNMTYQEVLDGYVIDMAYKLTKDKNEVGNE